MKLESRAKELTNDIVTGTLIACMNSLGVMYTNTNTESLRRLVISFVLVGEPIPCMKLEDVLLSW